MKKKIIFVTLIILLIMLIPIKNRLKDGGSIEYKAILYKYTKIHRLSENSKTGYIDGWSLSILGKKVNEVINTYVEASPLLVIKKETNEEGFTKYLERDNKIIYLSNNIEKIYYYDNNGKVSLDYYITNSYQTLDDSMKKITSCLNTEDKLYEEETTVYKSDDMDITVIICKSNYIFIGDKNLNYTSDMCNTEV